MSDQELDSVEEEVAPQETEHNESNIDDSSEEVQQTDKEAEQERNWRAMRQRQKEIEWENQKLKEQNEWYAKNSQTAPVQQVEEDLDDPDDEYIPAGRVKRIASKQVQPIEKKVQELEARFAREDQNRLVSSLRTKFSDFDDVVNVETLELLEKNEPELAATIAEFKDPYKMGIQSYKYIKALGIVDSLPNSRRTKEVEKKMEKNSKSVQTPMAYDKRPIAQAMKSSAAENKKLYEEMMFYASQASGL